jgi:hypothetical protein
MPRGRSINPPARNVEASGTAVGGGDAEGDGRLGGFIQESSVLSTFQPE